MILFTTDISESNLLMAYNNCVVRFESDSDAKPLNCNVTGTDLEVLLYPTPSGSFFFNFRDYITALVNTRQFRDDLITDIYGDDIASFTYDFTAGTFLEITVTFQINLDDTTIETITRTWKFILGVEQIQNWKRQEIPTGSGITILSPVEATTNNTAYLKYWEGYPFDIPFYCPNPEQNITLRNTTIGIDDVFIRKGIITRLFLSDGRTDVSIQDFVPIVNGINLIEINDKQYYLELEKMDSTCGVYLKWVNKYGVFNYWLFDNTYSVDRATKQLTELDNDNENIEATFAPTVITGKSSQDTIRLIAELLTEKENRILADILDSPKVLMFTGERFSQSDATDWIEVQLKTTKARIKEAKNVLTNHIFDIELPARYMQEL